MTELLFVFEKTTDAISAERALLASGLAVRVMSLPPSIRAGCGICLRMAREDGKPAKAIMHEKQINDFTCYARLMKGQQSEYIPFDEKC